jgi:hypothetical protein
MSDRPRGLGMTVDALRREGRLDALYLDNGSTYRGDILKTACAPLGITLLQALQPRGGRQDGAWTMAAESRYLCVGRQEAVS